MPSLPGAAPARPCGRSPRRRRAGSEHGCRRRRRSCRRHRPRRGATPISAPRSPSARSRAAARHRSPRSPRRRRHHAHRPDRRDQWRRGRCLAPVVRPNLTWLSSSMGWWSRQQRSAGDVVGEFHSASIPSFMRSSAAALCMRSVLIGVCDMARQVNRIIPQIAGSSQAPGFSVTCCCPPLIHTRRISKASRSDAAWAELQLVSMGRHLGYSAALLARDCVT